MALNPSIIPVLHLLAVPQALFSDPYFVLVANFIAQFWWVIFPFVLYGLLRFAFVQYMETAWLLHPDRKRILLEVRIPQRVTRPLRAMENFFNAYWASYDAPKDWRTTFFEGKVIVGTSFEMASLEGVPHFYIRTVASNRQLLEGALYAQYPDLEIVEVPDYVLAVPQDIPNKGWDLWGCDFMPLKPDPLPIKTYEAFFEEKVDIVEEGKRLDPLASVLEQFAKIGKGEYIWIQLNAVPISPAENDYIARGKIEIDKILKRYKPPKNEGIPSFLSFFADFFIEIEDKLFGDPFKWAVKSEQTQELFPQEMKMTPGERDRIAAIEKKISKVCYWSGLRFVYIARRDVFFGGIKAFGGSYTSQFTTQNLNGLKPWSPTITKIQSPDLFTGRRLFVKKRDLFQRYKDRDFSPGGKFVMNVEELTTLYHFPGIDVAPSAALNRIEIKKVPPPITLPVED
ncbi:MAG: hypothetical protein PHG23_02370 [Candidatus Pacebacteria bacterium]|nr:hypothetical protein [Candidatus Paceibacterota bacterium]